MTEATIMVFGDSITYGVVDNELGGWVNRLRLDLANREKNGSMVFNLGISGEITQETLVRFENECNTRYDADRNTIVVFAIGINDTKIMNGKYIVSEEQFQRNIKDLIEKAKKFTENILFVGLTKVDETKEIPFVWDGNTSFSNERIKEFDDLLEAVCGDLQIAYIKTHSLLSANELADGLHPDGVGHQKICDVVLKEIKKLLQKI
jgi:Lysophospholipase L1 and related esterases